MKILAFSGVDKTGKSTLIKEVHKQSNYEYICVDRFIIDNLVYGRINNRYTEKQEKELLKMLDSCIDTNNFIFILVTADKSVIKKRMVKERETDIKFEDINKHTATFLELFNDASSSSDHFIVFPNNYVSPVIAAKKLLTKIRRLDNGSRVNSRRN